MATLVVKPTEIPQQTATWFRVDVGGDIYNPVSAVKPYSITSVDNNTLRFELRDNDQHWWDARMGHRSERAEIAGIEYYPDGEAVQVSYTFKLEEGAPNTANWMVLGQLHMGDWSGETGAPPPFQIGLQGEKMVVFIGYTAPDGTNVQKKIFTDAFDIDRGHRYDMDVKAVFDADGNGRLILTRDGVTVVDYKGSLGYQQQSNVYWAEGVYRDSSATETVVAEFGNLQIKSGDAVEFPAGETYVAAPKMTVTGVGDAAADGSRHVLLSGTAKPGATVTVSDGGTVLGVATADANGNVSLDLKIAKGAETLLSSVAVDAAGHKGVLSLPISVNVGTSAEIAARLIDIAQQGNVGAIVITDTPVLTVAAGQVSHLRTLGKDALDKIQGSYSFLETQAVTGQPYDRQDVSFTSEGVIVERMRYSNGVLTFKETPHADGTKEVMTRSATGGTDVTQYNAAGQFTRIDQSDASGKLLFTHVKNADGSQDVFSYNAVTGLLKTHTATAADNSRVVEELNITGKLYTKQVSASDASGKLLHQERYDADGKIIWSQVNKADGSRELTAKTATGGTDVTIYSKDLVVLRVDQYNAAGKLTATNLKNPDGSQESFVYNAAGVLTNHTLIKTDNSRIVEELNVTGQPYTKQVYTSDAFGKILSQERYDAGGKIIWSQVNKADGGRELTVKTASGGTDVTIYSKDQVVLRVDQYDATGKLTSNNLKNPDGSNEFFVYNSAGVLTSHTVVKTDSSRVVEELNITGRAYTKQVYTSDASGKVIKHDRYDAGGTIIWSQVNKADGSTQLTAKSATGGTDITQYAKDGAILRVDQYDVSGKIAFTQIKQPSGAQETFSYNKVTGLLTNHSVIKADGSRVNEDLNITGQTYTKQVYTFDSTGKLLQQDRIDAGGKVIWSQLNKADGTRELTTKTAAGGTDITTYNKDGSLLRLEQYDAAGKHSFTQVKYANGAQETWTYSAVTGLAVSHNVTNADKSRLSEELNIVGRAYSKQTYTFDATGKMIRQDRIEADGTLIWSQINKSDGSRETHSYDGITGKETTLQLHAADGSRVDIRFDVPGKPYSAIAVHYSAANKVTGTDTYDAAGKLLASDRWNPDGTHKVFVVDAAGHVTGHKLYLTNGTFTETSYAVVLEPSVLLQGQSVNPNASKVVDKLDPVSGVKTGYSVTEIDGTRSDVAFAPGTQIVQTKTYVDAAGRITGTEAFDSLGHRTSLEIKNSDGSKETHRFDPVSGKETSSTVVGTNGVRTETAAVVNKPYDKQVAVFDAANKIVSQVRWDGDRVVLSETFNADGTRTTSNYAADGSMHRLTTDAVGRLEQTSIYNTAGLLTSTEIRHLDGSREIHRFDTSTGKEAGLIVIDADRSRVETTFGIVGRAYDEQSQSYDSAGKSILLTRSQDHHVVFTQAQSGTDTIVHNYDLAGRNTLTQTIHGDGSREVGIFQYSADVTKTDPVRIQEEYYRAGGIKERVDVTDATGAHEQRAFVTGANLTSHQGVKDVFFGVSAGSDRFLFDDGAGKDIIRNFETAGIQHDVIQIDSDFAHDFADLSITMVGNDAVIAFNQADTISLTNVQAAQLNQSHFLFI